MPLTIPSTAWSTAASSKTTLAALPPSSSVSRLPLPARVRWIDLPTSVEPVKATLSTSAWDMAAAPVWPAPVTMLTTPGGSSACSSTWPSSSAVSGVVSAGLSTTVLPAASAGASFQAAISSGKFHGITCAAARRAPGEGVLELVGPAGVVEEVRGGQRHVHVARFLDRLAAVDGLEHRELAGALLEDPRDAVEVLGPLGAGGLGPDSGVGRAGGAHRQVHVLLAGLGDLRQRLLRGRVHRLEMALRAWLDPLAADQQPVVLAKLDVVGRLWRGRVVQIEARRGRLRPRGHLLGQNAHPSVRRSRAPGGRPLGVGADSPSFEDTPLGQGPDLVTAAR